MRNKFFALWPKTVQRWVQKESNWPGGRISIIYEKLSERSDTVRTRKLPANSGIILKHFWRWLCFCCLNASLNVLPSFKFFKIFSQFHFSEPSLYEITINYFALPISLGYQPRPDSSNIKLDNLKKPLGVFEPVHLSLTLSFHSIDQKVLHYVTAHENMQRA